LEFHPVKSDKTLNHARRIPYFIPRKKDMVASYPTRRQRLRVKPVEFHEFVNAIKELGVSACDQRRTTGASGSKHVRGNPCRILSLEDYPHDAN